MHAQRAVLAGGSNTGTGGFGGGSALLEQAGAQPEAAALHDLALGVDVAELAGEDGVAQRHAVGVVSSQPDGVFALGLVVGLGGLGSRGGGRGRGGRGGRNQGGRKNGTTYDEHTVPKVQASSEQGVKRQREEDDDEAGTEEKKVKIEEVEVKKIKEEVVEEAMAKEEVVEEKKIKMESVEEKKVEIESTI